MPTIKDIAKIAGVSHGTVSNVLNGRGNVSIEKIEAVQRAAKQMGYQINARAQSLRASGNQGVALILPDINAEQYHQLYRGLQQTLQQSFSGPLDLYLTNDLPATEAAIIQTLAARGYQAIVTVSSFSHSKHYYDVLKLPVEQILFVYRQPVRAKVCFNLDFAAAGKAVAALAAARQPVHVGVLCEPLEHTNSDLFITALKEAFRELSPVTRLTVIGARAGECPVSAFDFFRGVPPDAFITQDNEKTRCITQAAWFGSAQPCPPVFQLCDNLPALFEGVSSYQMDYGRLGREIADYILGKHPAAKGSVLSNSGFMQAVQLAPVGDEEAVLNMLILPSPSTDALKKLLPHFYRQTGVKVNLVVYPYDEVVEILSSLHLHPWYDLLRIDMACFPWFAGKVLQPLEAIDPTLPQLLANFPGHVQRHFCFAGDTAWAFPFDSSTQVLFYRRDLFEDPVIKRMFYEMTGKELTVPTNFSDFDEISAFFNEIHQPGNAQRPMGTATTLGSSGLIATEFMLRYYALGGRLVHHDNVIKLDPCLATAALNQYLQQLTVSVNLTNEWWDASVKQFEQGNIAMLIMYLNLFNDVAHSPLIPAVGYAPVPGNTPQIGGGSLGMSRYSNKTQQVVTFFRWLYSADISRHLVLLGGNSAYKGLYRNQRILNLYPWFEIVNNNTMTPVRENCDFNGEAFNLRQVEIIISQGVVNAVNNIMGVEQAIEYINSRISNEIRVQALSE